MIGKQLKPMRMLGSWPRGEVSGPTESTRNLRKGRRGRERKRERIVENFLSLAPHVRSLTLTEVEEFLILRNRDAASLLCAFRHTDDPAYLREALEGFPDDPEVLSAALRSKLDVGNRQELIERLKVSDPENALGNYLAAVVAVLSEDPELMLAEPVAGSAKRLDDFGRAARQTDQEAFIAAGYSVDQAKVLSFGVSDSATSVHGFLAPLEKIKGEAGQAEKVREVQLAIARQLYDGGATIDMMVGQLFEKRALQGEQGAEARQRLAELEAERARFRIISEQLGDLWADPQVFEADWVPYLDRVNESGEAAAIEWLLERHR